MGTEFLQRRYYTVFDLIGNACLTGKKLNNEILPVGFDHLDKISMLFADITWINSASICLWEGVSSLWWLIYIGFFLDSDWCRTESRLLKPLNAILYIFVVSQGRNETLSYIAQDFIFINPLTFNLFASCRVLCHWFYDSVSAPISLHHSSIHC